MLNIVLFGPPGAGKGTQSQKLIEKYNLVHLSTGDILRGEIAAGTALGLEAKKLMDAGMLVPDEVVIAMISTRLDQNAHAKGFIFDGFPRTAAQAEALDKLLTEKGTEIGNMIALEVDDEELTKRLLLRGKDSGRPDDQNEDVIRKRIEEYNSKTAPLKDYYSNQNKFESVHGIGSIDEIFTALSEVMDAKKAKLEEGVTTKVVNLVKAVADRVMPASEEKEEKTEAPAKEKKAPVKEEKQEEEEKPSLAQRVMNVVKRVVKKAAPVAEKAPVKKAAKKAAKKVVKKAETAVKKVAKKAAAPKKAAKKIVKKAATKAAPKKAVKAVKNAVKKAAPKKAAAKKVVKTVKKAANKVAAKKAVKTVKKAAKKVIKKAAKKVAPKKAVKKAIKKVVKKVAKKAAPKKAMKAMKTVKKAVKKVAPKKAIKKVIKKAAKKAAPKKAIKAVKKVAKKAAKKRR